jgi:hypothetical protein
MISYFLGIISVYLCRYLLTPQPIVIYGNEALEFIGYEDMGHQYSTIIDDARYSWDVDKLWIEFESIEPIDWTIPDSFKEEWCWGQSHPSDHIERCLKADLSYPILVWNNTIIDGCHRTIKALAENKKTIKAKVIKDMPSPSSIGELDPVESNDNVHWNYGDMVRIVQAISEYEMMKEYDYRHPLDGV